MKKEITTFLLLSLLFFWQASAQIQIPISNGNFEMINGSKFADWNNLPESGGANFSIETTNLIAGSTKALKAEITSLGANPWNTGTTSTYRFKVIAGNKYTVSFYAKKEGSDSSIIRLVFQSTGNYQTKNITLTDTWQLYTNTFTAKSSDDRMNVKFWYLETNTTYFMDEVSVLDVDGVEEVFGNDVNFTISETFQTIEGFGGGIKRGTKELLKLNPILRRKIEELCFKYLEVNMIRFFVYHKLEPVNDDFNPFSLDENELDWRRYENGSSIENFFVVDALNNAFNLSVNGFDHIIGNANTGPGWMKKNNSPVRLDGATDGLLNTLRPGMEDEYAEFLTAFLKGMKSRYNIDVTALSPTNEPAFLNAYESMNLTPAELMGVMKSLKSKLVTESLSHVKVISSECLGVKNNTNYINEMFVDGEVKSAVDIVGTHTYADNAHSTDWNAHKIAASGKPVWVTESAKLHDTTIGMENAGNYAKWMLRGFNEGGLTAYMTHVFYQITDKTDGYGLVMVSGDGKITLPKRYFVMKHFANLIKKGFKVVTSTTNIENAMVGGFISPDGSKFVLQILNEGDVRDVVLDVPNGTSGIRHYLTSDAEADAFSLTDDLAFNKGVANITLNMPSMSMHSIVYDINPSLSTVENKLSEAKLFPNPANQELTITFGGSGNYELSVYQLNGAKVLYTKSISAPTGKLDVSSLSSGFYFIKINSIEQGLNTTLKFIKR